MARKGNVGPAVTLATCGALPRAHREVLSRGRLQDPGTPTRGPAAPLNSDSIYWQGWLKELGLQVLESSWVFPPSLLAST